MGESIYEFAHPCDHNDLKEMLTHNNIKTKDDNGFFIRLKCAITNTGKVLNVKSANFKVNLIYKPGRVVSKNCYVC